MLIADVAVPVPLGRPFSYEVPAALEGRLLAGMRVLCQFGPRKTLGVVLDVSDRELNFDRAKLKPITAIVDDEPVLFPELLGFLRELAAYYLAPIGEVLRMALPALERTQVRALHDAGQAESLKSRTVGRREVTMVRLVPGGAEKPPAAQKLRGRALEILEHL
jgi:primosomal protein N'